MAFACDAIIFVFGEALQKQQCLDDLVFVSCILYLCKCLKNMPPGSVQRLTRAKHTVWLMTKLDFGGILDILNWC